MARTIKRAAKDLTETTDTDYPQFKVWQLDDPKDNGWCLNIRQSAGQAPIEIRELPNLGAVKQIIEGFLEDSASGKACE